LHTPVLPWRMVQGRCKQLPQFCSCTTELEFETLLHKLWSTISRMKWLIMLQLLTFVRSHPLWQNEKKMVVETAAKSACLCLSDFKWAVISNSPLWAKLNIDIRLLHLISQSTQNIFRKEYSFCKSRLNVHFRFSGIFKVMSTVQSTYYSTKITVIILNLSYHWCKQKPVVCVVTWFSDMTSFTTSLKNKHWSALVYGCSLAYSALCTEIEEVWDI